MRPPLTPHNHSTAGAHPTPAALPGAWWVAVCLKAGTGQGEARRTPLRGAFSV